jgi:hypothetical protein
VAHEGAAGLARAAQPHVPRLTRPRVSTHEPADSRSFLTISYTTKSGAKVQEQTPMYRYQNNGDGGNSVEDNGGDGW